MTVFHSSPSNVLRMDVFSSSKIFSYPRRASSKIVNARAKSSSSSSSPSPFTAAALDSSSSSSSDSSASPPKVKRGSGLPFALRGPVLRLVRGNIRDRLDCAFVHVPSLGPAAEELPAAGSFTLAGSIALGSGSNASLLPPRAPDVAMACSRRE